MCWLLQIKPEFVDFASQNIEDDDERYFDDEVCGLSFLFVDEFTFQFIDIISGRKF